ncbi:MAG TPA: carbon-nitrogen hydrolase family protein [Victivallales bacterium]|nr:carbon-nitrogen hydrolase family protein [Victivallales bacterium]
MNNYLRIAASQFPVSHDMAKNFQYIKKLIEKASNHAVEVIHFPETALPGYLSATKRNPLEFDWNTLESYTNSICELARLKNIWVILGSIRIEKDKLPRNCICIISNLGKIIGYYDKQRIYKGESEYYSAGNSPFIVNIKNHKCGFLICYDNCFPELYTAYRDLGAGLIFHSFHNAGNKQVTSINNLMEAHLLVRSADNQIWISASNSSRPYSPLPATIVRPDGSSNKAKRHTTGIIIEDYPKAKLGWTYNNTII